MMFPAAVTPRIATGLSVTRLSATRTEGRA
jgi:hypothetical protein